MSGYSDILGQASMIFDHVRNQAYEKAILAQVTPESVVLDLGAGLGLHGLMAARAGARKVYLVDPSPAVFAAEKVAKANGLDNVVCLQGHIEELELDEPVDLIISVFTGNFLLTEDLLPSLFYARDHFLKEGGVLIPDRAKMLVAPVSMPGYYANTLARWHDQSQDSLASRFGIDYSVLGKQAENAFYYDDFTAVDWQALAEEKVLTEIDFRCAEKAESFSKQSFISTVDSNLHGWLGWFDMHLDGNWLSTSPKAERLHWSQVFIPVATEQAISEGDVLSIEIKRPEYGDWSWESLPGSTGYQSTFLARISRPEDIQKQSPLYQPSLSVDGQVLVAVLQGFSGQNSVEEIVQQLLSSFPKKFPDHDKALRYVQSQARLFS